METRIIAAAGQGETACTKQSACYTTAETMPSWTEPGYNKPYKTVKSMNSHTTSDYNKPNYIQLNQCTPGPHQVTVSHTPDS